MPYLQMPSRASDVISGSPEERALIARAQAGDIEARNYLVERHMAFIKKWVWRACRGIEADEFLSYGVEAFIRAIMKFNLDNGVKLLTYAGHAITSRVWRAKYHEEPLVHVPSMARKDPAVQEDIRRARSITSIDAPSGHEDAADSHWRVRSTRDPETDERLRQIWRMRRHIEELGPRERTIIERRLEGATLTDIGVEVGLTKERVRQIQNNAIAALRERMVPDHGVG